MPCNPFCTKCSLKDWTHVIKTVCLWGEVRNPDPSKKLRVMVLGEAPGYNEDLSGHVFIGESGRLLREAFNSIGFTEPFYITNVAKCFPPVKLPRDAPKGCASYLEEEIEGIKPEFILALGNTAIQRLIGKGKITELAGKEIWSERYNCWIVPALHPAAILRSRGRYSGWLADLQHFKSLIDGTLSLEPELKVYEVDTPEKLDSLARVLKKAGRFSFDFEATPLEWWHQDWKPYCISFSVDGAHSFVLPLEHPDKFSRLDGSQQLWMIEVQEWAEAQQAAIFQNPEITKVSHNRLYDTLAWWRAFNYQIFTTDCSMIAVQVLNENEPKSLKWQGRTRLGWSDWDIDTRELHPWPETRDYNAKDSAADWLLHFTKYLPELAEQGLLAYYQKLCMQNAAWIERMIHRGMPVNLSRLVERAAQAERDREAAALLLPVTNPNSSQQVARWLYQELDLPVLKLTPGGEPSTDKDTINRLAMRGHGEAKDVLIVRKHDKNINTYYKPILKMVQESFDHRLHPDIRMASVETGRHSSFMHTIPRDALVRSIIDKDPLARDPSWELVELDFSQLEARLSAWSAAGRPRNWSEIDWSRARMLHAFYQKRDVYKEMAAAALGKPESAITLFERQEIGKVPVLAMLYKISWMGLKEYAWHALQLDWSDGFARHIHQTFNQLFPEFPRWHEQEGEIILSRGWVRTEIGRMRRLPDAFSHDKKAREEAVRSGINMPIQGLGSDILQAAGIAIDRFIDPSRARIIHEIHDALLLEIDPEQLLTLVPVLKNYMEYAHRSLRPLGLYLPDGLLLAEEKIGPWGLGLSLEKYQAQLEKTGRS